MKLIELCEFIVDCEHKTAPIQHEGIPSIRTPNVGRGRIILKDVNRVSEKTYIEWTARAKPQNNDIILAREAPIGNVAIIKNNLKVCLGQRTVLIRPNNKNINPDFLVYFLLSPEIQSRILGVSNGATVHHLNMKDIRNLEIINLPNLQIQNKVGTVMKNYDDIIDNNSRRIQLLESMAKLVYDEWFVKFKFPGHEIVKMVESGTDFGKIPEEWQVKNIGDGFNVVLGGTPSRNTEEYWGGNIPWINSGKVNDLRIIDESEFITELGLKKSSTKMMPKRTTVMAITGATLGQVSLTEMEVCANQSVVGIYDKDNIYSEYIYLKVNEIIKDIIAKAGGGAQQHINKDIVCETQVIIPADNVMMKFIQIIQPIFNEISNLLFKNKNLATTRDLLLPKLISGELDVSELDIKVSEVEV